MELVNIENDKSKRSNMQDSQYALLAHYNVIEDNSFSNRIIITSDSPQNLTKKDDLRFHLEQEVTLVYAEKADILQALKKHSKKDTGKTTLSMPKYDRKTTPLSATTSVSPIIGLVNTVITNAIKNGSSDIHFEPFQDELKVRYRLDGVLREINAIPKARMAEVVSRLKIMANMDIAEKRRPQDGRIRMEYNGSLIDIRVSTLPTEFGEKVVLRILDKSHLGLDLEKLGFDKSRLETYKKAIKLPYGMILVTGPTGSGKTTTLYAGLNYIKSPEINISTVEDPIEYNLEGINQSQVKPEINYTFAEAIKTFLRQDPNVIMVGEIRDPETANIANRAAMTGHLVLSTLHTNDAPSAVNRLIDLGLAPFQMASSVSLIVAQRLVRKICQHCRIERPLTTEQRDELRINDNVFSVGEGCDVCGQTGYKGRIGLYEVMPVSPAIKELIMNKANAYDIRLLAVQEGMLGLREDGIVKMKDGITTAAEVLRETRVGL